jgi:ubiquinone/menaquinone biosynthesis C-methylase UbiE
MFKYINNPEVNPLKDNNKNFLNRYSKIYDFEINLLNGKSYAEMIRLMARSLASDMAVLEIATGTGLIAVRIAQHVRSIEAIDFSPKMIAAAKKKAAPDNLRFSVEDATALSFPDNTFDAVIISNALHIMPDPAKVLSNIKRVLKPGGKLIAPTYAHGHLRQSSWDLNAKLLKLIGFETYAKWTPEEYVAFIERNGFRVENWRVLKAASPLVYLEAVNE